MNLKGLIRLDSGMTNKYYFEDINTTLEATNAFIYSPVIESGVDITIQIQKIYGILCGQSNSQRAYMQMLARCRKVKGGHIDIANGPLLKINKNHNFRTYKDVLEFNKGNCATRYACCYHG